MKTCPICKARSFNDMEVCYGCLHHFEKKDSQTKQPKHERVAQPVRRRIEKQSAQQLEKSSAGMALPEIIPLTGLVGGEKRQEVRAFGNPLNTTEELLAEYQLVISLKPVVGTSSQR